MRSSRGCGVSSDVGLPFSVFWVCLLTTGATAKAWQFTDCSAQSLARYRVTLDTYWARDVLPKQYPLYRPNAQWSKLVGRSHSDSYTLWSLNAIASPALKQFAETSSSTLLDEDIQGSQGVLDVFNTMPIHRGVGSASAEFVVSPTHTKMSAVARIVPSPDWFVGVDAVQLCQGQEWLPEVTFELDPLDAGTDQGYTFTAPNWPESSAKPISQITSAYPSHPAASFRYLDRPSLPKIARITITRVELISHEERTGGTLSNDDAQTDFSENEHLSEAEVEMNHHSSPRLLATRQNHVQVQKDSKEETSATSPPLTARPRKASRKQRKRQREKGKRRKEKLSRKRRERRKKANILTQHDSRPVELERNYGYMDCLMSEWSEWSACTKTCGFGLKTRTRTVLRKEENGGAPCDVMAENQMCGSMRTCGWNHFSRTHWGGSL